MLTRYQRMMVGLAEIGDGMITLLTLASYRANLSFRLTAYYEIRNLKG